MSDYDHAATACIFYFLFDMATTKRSFPASKQNGIRYVITMYRVVHGLNRHIISLILQEDVSSIQGQTIAIQLKGIDYALAIDLAF